jgi:hypothetical protein
MQFNTFQRKHTFMVTLDGEIVNGILCIQFHKNLLVSIYNTRGKLKNRTGGNSLPSKF